MPMTLEQLMAQRKAELAAAEEKAAAAKAAESPEFPEDSSWNQPLIEFYARKTVTNWWVTRPERLVGKLTNE